MPVKLFVWKNHRFLKAIQHPGHASVMMTPVAGSSGQPANDVYASWWPGGDRAAGGSKSNMKRVVAHDEHRSFYLDQHEEMSDTARIGLRAGGFAPRPGQQQVLNPSTGNMIWVQTPDVTIELPGDMELLTLASGDKIPGVGLNVKRMIWFWKLFCTAPNARYKMMSSEINCTSVALSILEAGGIHLFAGKKFHRGQYLVPNNIIAYVEEANEKIRRINETLATLENVGFSTKDYSSPEFRSAVKAQRSRRTIGRVEQFAAAKQNSLLSNLDLPKEVKSRFDDADMPTEIWTLEEWKSASYVKIGRRKEQVKAIDALVSEYHQLSPFHKDRPLAFVRKLEILKEILSQAHDHMRSKLKSDRHEAIFQIARQTQEVYQWYRLFEEDMLFEVQALPVNWVDPAFDTLPPPTGLDPINSADDEAGTSHTRGASFARSGSGINRLAGGVISRVGSNNSPDQITGTDVSLATQYALVEGALPPQEIVQSIQQQTNSEAIIASADFSGLARMNAATTRSRNYNRAQPTARNSSLEDSYQRSYLEDSYD